jgi:TetR/AcrR family transcriptional regulator, transcriptional repressor for nem operon
MARSREFDQDAVLTGAMEAFRRSGFGAVSIKDLESETGLKAGSIYNSFGDKAGLFRAAFDHYLEHVLEFGGDTPVPEAATRGLEILSRTFVDRLTAARVPGMSPPATTAAKLLTLYQGILVLIRAGWSKPALEDMINAEFDQIERKIT